VAPACNLLLLICVVTAFIAPQATASNNAADSASKNTNNANNETADTDPLYAAASELSRLHSVTVYNEDGLQLSLHVRGTAPDKPANIKSVSKSVLSLLTGIAIENGYLDSLQQPITEVLGNYLPGNLPETHSAALDKITIEHLLSMQTGLQRTSGRNYGAWVASDHWVHNALNRPLVDEPGGSMLYSTGNSHILAAILTEQTGQSLHSLAQQWLGAPLGINILPWTRSPEGVFMGGNEMHLSAEKLAELGQVYFNREPAGRLNNRKLISEAWITQSFTARTNSVYTDDPHGLGWFQYSFTGAQGEQVHSWYGRGYGGQVWYIFPQHQLSIVLLSDPTPPSRGSYLTTIHRFVEREILPNYL